MFTVIRTILIQTTEESIAILLALSAIILVVITALWLYNRRKFHNLAHQIPASIVKSYLDSIIQNSTSLKSSLFRGGGQDAGDLIPSIVPVSSLPTGNVDDATDAGAEIAKLRSDISNKNHAIADLESQIALLKAQAPGGGGNEAIQQQISKLQDEIKQKDKALQAGEQDQNITINTVTRERDELKNRLQEYEIIEDDLADLRLLKNENSKLKNMIEELGGQVPESLATPNGGDNLASAATPSSTDDSTDASSLKAEVEAASPSTEIDDKVEEMDDDTGAAPVVGEIGENTPAAVKAEDTAASVDDEMLKEDSSDNKMENKEGTEDLLSEFEKMLG